MWQFLKVAYFAGGVAVCMGANRDLSGKPVATATVIEGKTATTHTFESRAAMRKFVASFKPQNKYAA